MAHELEQRNGRIEAAFALNPAWHGLGTVLGEVPDSATMLQAAGLDWDVSLRTIVGEGNIDGGNMRMVVRNDVKEMLGIVTESYGIVQNRQAFDFLDSLQQDGIMRYESAGALRGGRKVWVLGRMPSVDQIAAKDDALRYVLFTTSHDGSGGLQAIPTSVRVVCANTLRMALEGKGSGIRHIGDMAKKLDAARKMLAQFDEAFTDFRDNARKLATISTQTDAGRKAAAEYIATLFPEVKEEGRGRTIRENKVAQIRANYVNSRNSLASMAGTWWALYNSVSEYADHQASFKGEGREKMENRMISSFDGDGAALKDKAFNLALNLSGAAS